MNRLLSFIFIFFNLCASSQEQDSIKYLSLDPRDFQIQYLAHDSSLLIDVREFFEFRKSRIKGALLLPSSIGYEAASDTINKDYNLFFYCYSGGRSLKAVTFFYNRGFRKLYNLKGGITAWKKDGLPTDRKRIRKNRIRT